MDFSNVIFKRKFSMPMFKNLHIKMGEMVFTKGFINASDVTDVYPIIEKSSDCEEFIKDNLYYLKRGNVERWFCEFFPHASYEILADIIDGKAGLSFKLPDTKAEILFDKENLYFSCGETINTCILPDYISGNVDMVVTCEPSTFNIYFFTVSQ